MQRLPISIGYVEYAYARQSKMTYTQLKNRHGQADDLEYVPTARGELKHGVCA